MQSSGGEDLSWFWRGWFMNNWTLDLAVTSVRPVKGDWRKGAEITVANLDPLVMPATVKIAFQDGTSTTLKLPAESWMRKASVDLTLDSTKPVTEVTVDPAHVLPDKDTPQQCAEALSRLEKFMISLIHQSVS